MNIKLISMDLDGTLIEKDNHISDRNKEALEAARQKGIPVTISTGRMFRSAQKVAQQLALDVPIITYNGAYIKTSASGQVLLNQTLDKAIAQDIIIRAQEEDLTPQAFTNDTLLVAYINRRVADYALSAGVPAKAVGDLPAFINADVNKVLLIGEADHLTEFWHKSGERYGHKVNIVKSKPHYLDFINPKANKGQGLAFLAHIMKIKKEQIMAIGDSYNDIGLFEAAGLKIAMGNAVAQLKEKADYITSDCAQDGLAAAIEKFVL
ncbi:MAG: Cof-type HAD-IIB family hydrolase [Bacillota bacterium]|jgi:Cof subfamily protein (haloacid dehalogenase superfamily)